MIHGPYNVKIMKYVCSVLLFVFARHEDGDQLSRTHKKMEILPKIKAS